MDLSRVKSGRLNLEGDSSGLFWEVIRIIKLLKQVFGFGFEIRFIIENVSSMDASAEAEISKVLGRKPYHVNPFEAVPIQRPRFCWTNVDCEIPLEGSLLVEHDRYVCIKMPDKYPADSQWMEPGWTRTEEEIYPTCMKAIKRKNPPSQPAGLARCDKDTQHRWAADSFKFPPYQYQARFLLWKGSKWRLLSSDEREILHGMGYHHTFICWPASRIKQDPEGFEDARKSLIGDSFSMFSFAYFAAQACRRWIPNVTLKQLFNRMGMAPGYCAPLWVEAPLQVGLTYGNVQAEQVTIQDLHRCLLRRVNHTGSDVRITTGQVLNPKAFPRQSVEAQWWKWRPLFAYRWKKKDHINGLELRAILHAIIFRIRHHKEADLRIFHITDSYVCMSVVSKGRSSSIMLRHLLRRLSCWLLAFQLQLVIMHVESTENPTDEQSRLGSSAHSSAA